MPCHRIPPSLWPFEKSVERLIEHAFDFVAEAAYLLLDDEAGQALHVYPELAYGNAYQLGDRRIA